MFCLACLILAFFLLLSFCLRIRSVRSLTPSSSNLDLPQLPPPRCQPTPSKSTSMHPLTTCKPVQCCYNCAISPSPCKHQATPTTDPELAEALAIKQGLLYAQANHCPSIISNDFSNVVSWINDHHSDPPWCIRHIILDCCLLLHSTVIASLTHETRSLDKATHIIATTCLSLSLYGTWQASICPHCLVCALPIGDNFFCST